MPTDMASRARATQSIEQPTALPSTQPPVPAATALPAASFGSEILFLRKGALLALPGQADTKIRELLADPAIAYIDAHNAAHGCFAARIDRN